jgi:hypothetical protein
VTKGEMKMPSTALLDGMRAVLMAALEPSDSFVEDPRRGGMYLQYEDCPFIPQPYSIKPMTKKALAHTAF